MRAMVLLFAAGVFFLASCGRDCPSGANSSDPSCPAYTTANQGTYSYGGTPNGYYPQQYDPYGGGYDQSGYSYNQQQGGYYGNGYGYGY